MFDFFNTPNTKYGTCEYCGVYSSVLHLSQMDKTDEAYFLNRKERVFYSNPFWACNRCQITLSRIWNIKMVRVNPRSTTIRLDDIRISPVKKRMVRKMREIQGVFPKHITGVYLLPSKSMPPPHRNKVNVAIAFKNLSFLKYFNHVVRKDNENLVTSWVDGSVSRHYERSRFFTVKLTRILLALSRIHCSSDLISLWVWGDTRIVSIEFFCKNPVSMIQATPNKVLRIK